MKTDCNEEVHSNCSPTNCSIANFEYREQKLYSTYCPECERPIGIEFMVCFSCQEIDYIGA